MNRDRIEIFGKHFWIAERMAIDCIEFAEIVSGEDEVDSVRGHYLNALVISKSLGYNISRLKKWQFIKRLKYRRLFEPKNILRHLSPAQLNDLVKRIYRLEGIDLDEVNRDQAVKRDPKKKLVEK